MAGERLLNYRQYGQPGEGQTPVIIVHGLFGSMDNLSPTARRLAESRWVVAADLRNHGRSFHDAQMSYSLMAEDILALMDHLEIDEVAVIGHSMGGKVAMQLALMAPERVAAVVVGDIAPVDYLPGHDDVLAAIRSYKPEQALSRTEADQQFAHHIAEPAVRQLLIKNLMRNERGEFVWRINASGLLENYDNIKAAPVFNHSTFDKPVLFIKGSESEYLQPEHKAIIGCYFPKAELKVVSGAGHWFHAEKPDVFNGIVERFLNTL
ncbi:alpha/beta fold hydrolase [Sansalvadorimonas verongulae]|uniref:alpha/beta fold hydrolase n=1 Tax=Sansalvadorimonas verongulae TaxID=2172824 RepID=UPI0012BBC180|nr:alpha/beta fold hydrolase [Sansalvadorimonas verongulae]MTI15070.1 alpha/beta fold hydrolase [Sansalvadorimonas verongulae]